MFAARAGPEEAVETEINEKSADEKVCRIIERRHGGSGPILQVVELITSLDMIVTSPCAPRRRSKEAIHRIFTRYILYWYVGAKTFSSGG